MCLNDDDFEKTVLDRCSLKISFVVVKLHFLEFFGMIDIILVSFISLMLLMEFNFWHLN